MRKRQDSVFERDYVSTPTRGTHVRALVLASHLAKPYGRAGYRLRVQLPLRELRVGSRHDGIRSSPRCIDVKIQRKILVEIALTRLIQRRVSFKSASRRMDCKWDLNPH